MHVQRDLARPATRASPHHVTWPASEAQACERVSGDPGHWPRPDAAANAAVRQSPSARQHLLRRLALHGEIAVARAAGLGVGIPAPQRNAFHAMRLQYLAPLLQHLQL